MDTRLLRGAAGRLRRAGVVLAGGSDGPAWEGHSDMGEVFAAACDRVQPFTMTNRERMFALWQATRYVCRAGIPGDIVECGVWRGGSAMLAALAMADVGAQRPMWLFDTYEGMPPPTDRDRMFDGRLAADLMAEQARGPQHATIWAYATLQDVQQQMASVGHPEALLHYVQGRVEDTIPETAPAAISLLRLDTDWYESTLHELRHLWPRLSPGGVLIIDDYGFFQGAREAVDEFFAEQERPVLLNRIDFSGRLVVKP